LRPVNAAIISLLSCGRFGAAGTFGRARTGALEIGGKA
jgi:hypothetical protein